MIILLSPSKTQDFAQPFKADLPVSQPALLAESAQLVERLRQYSQAELAELMHISPRLAALNHERFRSWSLPFSEESAKPAGFAFQGDVYDGLGFAEMTSGARKRAQDRLRILSGLYGVLRPYDLIQPYRLEMGIRLANPRGRDLYAFWGDRLTRTLREESDGGPFINLASQEYSKAVQAAGLGAPFISPVFKERRGNKLQIIALMAKKARGAMARWLLENDVSSADGLPGFRENGYAYDDTLTEAECSPVFVRVH